MLEDGHKGLEAMSAACSAMKSEQWGDAERCLQQVQEIVGRLLREVGVRERAVMMAPLPEKGDRG
jgi:hypothetical protein